MGLRDLFSAKPKCIRCGRAFQDRPSLTTLNMPVPSHWDLPSVIRCITCGIFICEACKDWNMIMRCPNCFECRFEAVALWIRAKERFDLLLLLSDTTRKWSHDANRELEWLNECAMLVEKPSFPSKQPESDRNNMVYMMYMNRAIAADSLGLYVLADESLSTALQMALEPETKCKCLAYQVWAILQQQDPAKINQARAAVSQFDRLVTPHVAAPVIVQVEAARAVLSLWRNDVQAARAAAVRASHLCPTVELVREVMQIVLRPNTSEADAWEIVRKYGQEKAPEIPPRKPLSPLPEGIVEGPVDSELASTPDGSVISDQKHEEFEARVHALSAAGQYAHGCSFS